ncbi:hypothetical protein C8Q80DRAFT_1216565 [Daedaleopsis nitida]|nr:hypothetical protein C8Q80DRAFT_1216565 [Daedaleopsis nitida]
MNTTTTDTTSTATDTSTGGNVTTISGGITTTGDGNSTTTVSGGTTITTGNSTITTTTGALNVTTTTGALNITTTSTSSGTVISLPDVTSTSTDPSSLTTIVTVTPSVNSQFTFVTDSSLAVASQPSTTSTSAAPTDPDAPSTTLTVSFTSAADSSKPSTAPLPSGLPTQIFPVVGSKPGDPDLDGYSGISILFDSGLNWNFVVNNENSSSQIFAWMSPILQASLSLQPDQVKTYQLRVHVPDDYESTDDLNKLETMYLAWIPNESIDLLAQQLKVASSLFYTGLQSPYKDLAAHVVPSFPVNAVSPGGTSDNGNGSSASSSGASSSSKTREDAIIGVVSSLGAITLLILGFLVYRAVKQRRELAHRRLSDPHDQQFIGAAPDDHEFDRDSVGGQRRRSFYYAADSLRGFQDHSTGAEDPFNSGMRERRPPIGTPVLRDNTMNW